MSSSSSEGAPGGAARSARRGRARPHAAPLRFELPYRPPLDWDFFLAFHRARALPGVECVSGDCYARVARVGERIVTVAVSPARGARLAVALTPPDEALIAPLTPLLRRAFDLDADPAAIAAHLARDPLLRPRLERRPGLRVAGSVDAFEQAVRAILGQQISVAAARDLGGRLVARWGTPVTGQPELTHAFPTAAVLADADVASLGMPRRRGAAVSTLARAVLGDPGLLERGASLEQSIARLTALPGFGPWTAHYVAMRALREPDAFPAGDVGLLRAHAGGAGPRPTPAALSAHAERWRPWRAYAAQHRWADDAPVGVRTTAADSRR
jgi:3-methyladenine DNA glycosylase/8-oxoguanine DNA glycosylase